MDASGAAGISEDGYGNPVLFEVEINHLCWYCDLTEKNRDTSLVDQISSLDGRRITDVVKLTSPTPERDIELIGKHPLVRKADVLLRQPNTVFLKVISDYKAMTYYLLHQTNVTLLESPLTTNGVDSEILLAGSHREMDDLLSRWKEQENYYDVKLKKKRYVKPDDVRGLDLFNASGFFDLKSAKELLSEKQLSVFQLACEQGYYENPKRIDLEPLAEMIGVSPSTLAEHLRKAETKLLPILGKVLKKM